MRKKFDVATAVMFMFASSVLILGITYVSWRWLYTLNTLTSPLTTFWSYSLCFGEILTLAVFTNFCLLLLESRHLEKIVPDNKLQHDYYKDVFHEDKLVTFKNYCPSVDIFICTLNEDADLLATTLSACKNIDYPNKHVYVLDDGRRPEIKELADLIGCNYITRDTNKGFKAGNINNALEQTNSELIVIFDADHVPASTFLRETVYNFIDEKVALVQSPQYFCNPDAFQKNLNMSKFLANEQDMFYRIIEPSLNEFDSVFCGGTNIVLRRTHLAAVGNFPEDTITEDSLLGLIFHSERYKVIYYNRPIAIGLAASSFDEYIKQRIRWAKGNVQIVTNPRNWKLYAKLSSMQAFFYLSGVLYFFTPIARIIFLTAPVLFLFYDITPVLILFYQILSFQICYFGLKFLFIFTNYVKIGNVILADVYDLVTSIFTIGGILQTALIPKRLQKIKFMVTKKNFKHTKGVCKYQVVLTIIYVILVLAEMQGLYDLLYSDVYSELAIVANLFWNSINIVVLIMAIVVVSEQPEKRGYQRVKVQGELLFEDEQHHKVKAELYDTSRSGLSFMAGEELKDEKGKELKTNINGIREFVKLLYMNKVGDKFFYKTIFRKPISLIRLTRGKIYRLNKFVQLTYKNPDAWDDFFENKRR